MRSSPWRGLFAAGVTPFSSDGSVDLAPISAMVDHLIARGVSGFYVCGSTGEGPSLTGDERRQVADAYVDAVGGRVPVMIQVGHNSLREAQELARHAASLGVDAISATCPSYFSLASAQVLVDCMREVAGAAPELPFFYYHIPSLTGAHVDMVEFLQEGASRIPNLQGLKYTQPTLHEFQRCNEVADGRFDVLWGCDEVWLPALSAGARAAVGSTYNIAAAANVRIQQRFEAGELEAARADQLRSAEVIAVLARYPFHSALKETMRMLGTDVGICRLPFPPLDAPQRRALQTALEELDFYAWSGMSTT